MVFIKDVSANLDAGTGTKWGGNDINFLDDYFDNIDISPKVARINTRTYFRSGKFEFRDSDDSHSYIIVGGNLSANRNINIPVLGSDATWAFSNQSTTWTEYFEIMRDNQTLLDLTRDTNVATSNWGIQFWAKNSVNAFEEYGQFMAEIVTNTDGDEDGKFEIAAIKDGVMREIMEWNSSGVIEIFCEAGENTALELNRAAAGVSDDVEILFRLQDSLGNGTTYGKINTEITDPTDTNEDGKLEFSCMFAGSLTERMILNADGQLDIRTASGAGSGQLLLRRANNANATGIGIDFYALDSGSADQMYASIAGAITDNTAGAEDGELQFKTTFAGTLTTRMILESTGNLNILMDSTLSDAIHVYKAAPADESNWGDYNFDANDSLGNRDTFADFKTKMKSNTSGAEQAEFEIHTINAGTKAARIRTGVEPNGATRITTTSAAATSLTLFNDTLTDFNEQNILFNMKDDLSNETTYTSINAEIMDNTNATEDGAFHIDCIVGGSNVRLFSINHVANSISFGTNRRVVMNESGLTAARTFTFPDHSELLTGKSSAISNPYAGAGTSASVYKTGLWVGTGDTTTEGLLQGSLTAIGTGATNNSATEGAGRSFATGAVANNNAGLRWTINRFRREWGNYMILRVGFSSTSDIRVFIGWSSDNAEIAGETTLNNFSGCGVGKRAADTNWFTYTNDGDATEDRVDTGIVFATTTLTVQLALDATSFRSKIGTTTNTAVTTELPATTTMLYPKVEIETGAGAADKSINIFPIWAKTGAVTEL